MSKQVVTLNQHFFFQFYQYLIKFFFFDGCIKKKLKCNLVPQCLLKNKAGKNKMLGVFGTW